MLQRFAQILVNPMAFYTKSFGFNLRIQPSHSTFAFNLRIQCVSLMIVGDRAERYCPTLLPDPGALD
jgi:hypothetical protein